MSIDQVFYGCYVIFNTNRRPRYFVGKVIMINHEDKKFKIKFLQKKTSKVDNNIYFTEPAIEDISEVILDDVKRVLPIPKIIRRGMLMFDCKEDW